MRSTVEQTVPTLVERSCGGWLAVSSPGATLKIGVTADTEEEARAAFDRSVRKWEEALRQAEPGR